MATPGELLLERERRVRATLAEQAEAERVFREAEIANRRAREEFAAKRPARWLALDPLARALFVAASEDPRSIRGALLRVAELIGQTQGYVMRTPPSTFEPPSP
jgi:hypothetical protein